MFDVMTDATVMVRVISLKEKITYYKKYLFFSVFQSHPPPPPNKNQPKKDLKNKYTE